MVFLLSQEPFEVCSKTKGQEKGVKENKEKLKMLQLWPFGSYFKSTQTANVFQVTCKNLLNSKFIQIALRAKMNR